MQNYKYKMQEVATKTRGTYLTCNLCVLCPWWHPVLSAVGGCRSANTWQTALPPAGLHLSANSMHFKSLIPDTECTRVSAPVTFAWINMLCDVVKQGCARVNWQISQQSLAWEGKNGTYRGQATIRQFVVKREAIQSHWKGEKLYNENTDHVGTWWKRISIKLYHE